MRDRDPLNDRRPATLTVTLPAFPELAGKLLSARIALLEIAPPLMSERVAAFTITSPAFPALPNSEFVAMPVSELVLAAGFVMAKVSEPKKFAM